MSFFKMRHFREFAPVKGQLSVLFHLSFFMILTACDGNRVGFGNQVTKLGVPTVSINKGADFTNQKVVELTLNAKDVVEMYITWNENCESGGSWEAYSQTSDFRLQQENEQASVYVKFRAEDETESVCVFDTIVHDDIAPVLGFEGDLPTITNETSETFGFSLVEDGSGIASVECARGDDEFAPCLDALALADLNEGSHQIRVRAEDFAGNVSDVLGHTWEVDLTAPTPVFDQVPATPNNLSSVNFAFSSDDAAASFVCQFDNEVPQPCVSPLSVSVAAAADGDHTLTVVATDAVGNPSLPISYTWTTDRVAPTAMIISGPATPTNSTDATFEFSGADNSALPVSLYCQVDGGAPFLCTSPYNLAGVIDGSHSFSVIATDAAGNSSLPAVHNWMVDTIAPVLAFTSTPQAVSYSRSALFEYSVTEAGSGVATYSCELDGAVAACPILGSASFADLVAGPHNFKVTVADNAGNSSSIMYDWNIQNMCYQDRFVQPDAVITRKIDILFVSDSSASLDTERGEIAEEIDLFIQQLPTDAEARIGVLLAHGPSSNNFAKLYKKEDEPRVLDTETMSINEIRDALYAKLTEQPSDNSTDGGEVGLYALSQLIGNEQKLNRAKIHGFFRDDAALAVIFLADENDICSYDNYPQGVSPVFDPDGKEIPAYFTYCVSPNVDHATVYQQLVGLQGDRPLNVSGIIYTGEGAIPTGNEDEIGYGYTDIIALNGGLAIDLAGDNFAQGLAAIGQMVQTQLNLQTRFPLSQAGAIDSSFVVKIDGIPTAEFSYNSVTNEVNIPNPGAAMSVITIDYCVSDGSGGQ